MLRGLLALLLLASPCWAQFGSGISNQTPVSVTPEGTAVLSTGESSGDVLTSNGSGGSTWETPSAGDPDPGFTIQWSDTQIDDTPDGYLSGSGAPVGSDSNNEAITVAKFDGGAGNDEGRIFTLYIPTGTTGVIITTTGHATTAPGGATNVRLQLVCRDLTDEGAMDSWGTPQNLDLIAISTDENWQTDTHTAITLSALSCTDGGHSQFEILREPDDASDGLTSEFEAAPLHWKWDS